MWRLRILCCLASTQLLHAQSAFPSLDETRRQIAAALSNLPNYVCTETIEQWQRPKSARSFDLIERFRVDVAYVGGSELYGWPAGEGLREEDLTRLVGGTVTTGDFALLAQQVFGSTLTVFTKASAPGMAYNYTVPVEGGWLVIAYGSEAVVPYRGSVALDRELLHLRVNAAADGIPQSLGIASIDRTLEYARTRIGSSDHLLPQRAQLLIKQRSGGTNRSETLFQNCREYSVESAIHFEDPEPLDPPRRAAASITLPLVFETQLRLDAPIDSETAAVGDPVIARVQQDITRGGEVVIPKDTPLYGRIARLPMIDGHRYIDFHFRYFDCAGVRIPIDHRRNDLGTPIPGQGARVRLPAGYKLSLKSTAK